MQSMKTLYDLFHMYVMGGSHVGNHSIDLTNEVKAIQTLKTYTKYANVLRKLTGRSEKLVITDDVIIKVARETRPTIFQMEDPKARCYDDTKSVITYLNPYEDNTKNLKKHKKSKKCVIGKDRIWTFLKNPGDFEPHKVGF